MNTSTTRTPAHERALALIEFGAMIITLDDHQGANDAIDEAGQIADVERIRVGRITLATVVVDF
jgi:hypothetical protein